VKTPGLPPMAWRQAGRAAPLGDLVIVLGPPIHPYGLRAGEETSVKVNDLYSRSTGDFRRLCGGNQDEEEMESCVEIAPLKGIDDAFALRDSKNPGAGVLRFTGDELRAAGMQV
jgi:hypothetical protein